MPKNKVETDKFHVRWDHPADLPGFVDLKAGTQVEILEFLNTSPVEKDGNSKGNHLARVRVLSKLLKTTGLVRASFLQPSFPTGFPISKAGIEYMKFYHIDEQLWDCRWLVDEANLIEIAVKLRSNASAPFGSFVVAGLTELDGKTVPQWKQYLLIVKWFSGPLNGFLHEVRNDTKHADLFNGTTATTKERSRPSNAYSTGIAFLPIRRTSNGRFFVENCINCAFGSLFALLSYYFGRPLPLKENIGPALTLTQPFQVLSKPVNGPLPFSEKNVCPIYSMPSDCTGLFMFKDAKRKNYSRTFELDETAAYRNSQTFYGVAKDFKGVGIRAAIKKLNKNWFDETAFRADLDLLDVKKRKTNENLPEQNKETYFTHGSTYLAKIVAHSEFDSQTPFLAFELIQNVSLEFALRNGRQFSILTILEVCYQVAAGMSHLEANKLCHRGLCANNVIVHWTDAVSVSVKITDYMLPYHHLASKSDSKSSSAGSSMKQLRWQWMSPESLFHGIFDIVADSWSYGCLIFEIFNGGAVPFLHEEPKIETPENLKDFVLSKKKMQLNPNYDGPEILKIIFQNCFEERNSRAPFIRIVKMLHNFIFDHVSPAKVKMVKGKRIPYQETETVSVEPGPR